MLRAIVLSIALLVGMGTIVPLATEYAEAGQTKRKVRKKKKRYWRGVKKYSKRWWQLYNAQERRKKKRRALARKLKLQQMRLDKKAAAEDAEVAKAEAVKVEKAALLPTGDKAPEGWKSGKSSNGEVKFRVENGSGSQIGSASISVVGPAGERPERLSRRTKTLGGVPTTSLRREVINQMVRENGWVVNDYRKDIGGKEVYVVVAQAETKHGIESRMFYFTEANGRIYSVATNAGMDAADRLAEESEKVIYSIHGTKPVQQAAVRSVVIERPAPAVKPSEPAPCAVAAK